MVKGISRQVVVVRSLDTKLFEQAIFLIRDGALPRQGVFCMFFAFRGMMKGKRREPMEQFYRHPRDVVGGDPELLAYWNQIPPRARLRLLDSTITVSTLGELKKLAEELGQDTTVRPE